MELGLNYDDSDLCNTSDRDPTQTGPKETSYTVKQCPHQASC